MIRIVSAGIMMVMMMTTMIPGGVLVSTSFILYFRGGEGWTIGEGRPGHKKARKIRI
jgi:hypothetical protein